MIPTIVSTGPVYVDEALVADQSNRFGRLPEITQADVYEKLNGEFTAEITLPRVALNAHNLQRFGLIRLKPNHWQNNQIFRINRVKRQLVNGDITLQLNHLGYDLNKLPAKAFESTGISAVVAAFSDPSIRTTYTPFSFSSDLTNETSVLSVPVPTPWRSIIGGMEGSILDVFGGELLWDNLSVSLLKNRGQDRGVAIRYGLNIIEATQEENIANTYDGVIGYAALEDSPVVTGGVVYDGIGPAYPLVKVIDFSDQIPEGVTPTQAMITQMTEAWVNANHPARPQIGMTVDFTVLRQRKQFDLLAQLEDVRLGDTVQVILPEANVSQTAKVTGVLYDTINEITKKIELGSYQPRLSTTISSIGKSSRDATLASYPIGSTFSTYSKTNPAATIGGTWTLITTTGGLYTYRRVR